MSDLKLRSVKNRNLKRLLFGPGPCNSPQSVLDVMALPLLGHLDPEFGAIMDEVQQGLRVLFGTKNDVCFATSATGSGGMELLAMNLIEAGDTVVVGINGVFGGRVAEIATKLGANVVPIRVPFGEGISTELLKSEVAKLDKVDLVWVVHAETSTGYIHTNLKEMADVAHSKNALMVIDTVTGLGGNPVLLDEWGVDAAFSGTQKCLGAPPGLAPITLNERAVKKVEGRKNILSWYFDLTKLLGFWRKAPGSGKRSYHHTAPISSVYALHEAIRVLLEEGLDKVQARYRQIGGVVSEALLKRGFTYQVSNEANRLPNLHCVKLPEGVDELKLRQNLLKRGVEVGSGLGELAGKVIRVGVMGDNARQEVVTEFLRLLDESLAESK